VVPLVLSVDPVRVLPSLAEVKRPRFLEERKHEVGEFWKRALEQGSLKPLLPQGEVKKPSHSYSLRPRDVAKVGVCKGELPPVPPDLIAPKTLGEAQKSPWWSGFEKAIQVELESLRHNKTWELVDIKTLPRGTNILRSKFVFDIKRGSSGEFIRFKARMVAMGFTQVEGVDFNETFASVMTTKSFLSV
jgi:hypothetical protein